MKDIKEKVLAVFGQEPILASLATITEEGLPWVRYVMVTIDHYEMLLRLSTFINARKIRHIKKNPEVHLTCGCTSETKLPSTYLQIQGRASFSTEITEKEKVWHKMLEKYFTGKDDPNFGVIRIDPYRIEICSHTADTLVWQK